MISKRDRYHCCGVGGNLSKEELEEPVVYGMNHELLNLMT